MPNYNFLKEAQLYLEYEGTAYNIDISQVNFSQTTTENSFTTKTLHQQNYFESSVINKANPASFSFVMPALRGEDLKPVVDRLLDCNTFTLYISTKQDVFKLVDCIITNGTFQIEKSRPLSLAIEGQASKLSNNDNVPTVEVRTARVYNRVTIPQLTIGGRDISNGVYALNVELQNDIEWVPYSTVQGALSAGSSSINNGTMYPKTFVIKKKILGGSISRYLSEETGEDLQGWDTNTSLNIKVGQNYESTFYGFDFNISNCSFTNRLGVGGAFVESYDWRMTQNPASLTDVITYNT